MQTPVSWTPDAKWLAFEEINPSTGADVWVLSREGDGKKQPFLKSARQPHFSPDGRWLAYASEESGHPEIYVRPFPGPGSKTQVSTDGGNEPIWSRDRRELFYVNGDKMMAVDVRTQPAFSAGAPRLLFTGRYQASPNSVSAYDISPDGKRFLKIRPTSSEQAATQINVVINWFEELKQRVPIK